MTGEFQSKQMTAMTRRWDSREQQTAQESYNYMHHIIIFLSRNNNSTIHKLPGNYASEYNIDQQTYLSTWEFLSGLSNVKLAGFA